MAVFSLDMLPASEGDCLLLTWGQAGAERHALIDLGRSKNFRAARPALEKIGRFDLFVITHIDADHIEGGMPLVKEQTPAFDVGEVWFNGYHHLVAAKERKPQAYEKFSAVQAEKFSEGIRKFGWGARWNEHFGGGPVSVLSPGAGDRLEFAGGLSLRLLSPSDEDLVRLEGSWLREIERLGLKPGAPDREEASAFGRERFGGGPDVEKLAAEPFVEDNAAPNGSSIAFLAEFEGKRILLTGDAHPGRIEASLRKLGWNENNRLPLDYFKLSHHGSKANTSPGLLQIIDCARFGVSTDGTRHDHPDAQTIARILKQDPLRPKQLIFNFRQPGTTIWDDETLMRRWCYTCVFPAAGQEGARTEFF
jgi:beta-lactamase superfamily II metal-dependent hydrolase